MTQDSGTIEPNNLARVVMLVYGQMQKGKGAYWCYVAVKPGEYQRFMGLHKQRKINLYDFETEGFGEIIVSGQGVRPPSEVTHQIAKIYGMNIKDLFGDVDPEAVVAAKIAQMKESKKPQES